MKAWHDLGSGRGRAAASAVVVAAAALSLAACGGSTTYSSAGAGSGGGSSAASSGSAATISTASGPLGTYLTDGSGRAVYLWVADTGSTSTCTGACASAWPPVMTSGTPKASGGAMSSDLGTTSRSDGGSQVTYAGHPLYYFIKDTGADQTKGQGSNGFGAKWWLLDPAGRAITGSGSMGSSGSASGSSGW